MTDARLSLLPEQSLRQNLVRWFRLRAHPLKVGVGKDFAARHGRLNRVDLTKWHAPCGSSSASGTLRERNVTTGDRRRVAWVFRRLQFGRCGLGCRSWRHRRLNGHRRGCRVLPKAVASPANPADWVAKPDERGK